MTNLKQHFTTRNLYYGFLHVAVIALAIQVVVFANQNKELKKKMEGPQQVHLKEGEYFSVGDLIPVKNAILLDTTSRDQLIFVMTTTCPFCKESLPFWKDLADDRSLNLSVFAISLDEKERTSTYAVEQNISFPVFIPFNVEEFIRRVKSSSVPKTIIRAKDGRVRKIITGRLKKESIPEIASAATASLNSLHQ